MVLIQSLQMKTVTISNNNLIYYSNMIAVVEKKKIVFSEKARHNISLSRTGMKLSEEHKKNISLGGLGKNLGKHHSDESKKKLSEAHKGKKLSEEHKRKIGLGGVGRKHSEDTKKKISLGVKGFPHLSQRGDKHYKWKGGITTLNVKARKSIEMRLWRNGCMERDNFTCQKTGQIGGKLVVHHINNFADFPELRTSFENGITLSKETHELFHKIYGRRNNTREQLLEFINKKQ